MSNMFKIVLGVGAVIVVLVVVLMSSSSSAPSVQQANNQVAPAPEAAPTAEASAEVTPIAGTATADASAKDTSDASLDKDMSSIDMQASALGADSASADKGLNDQPVSQAE